MGFITECKKEGKMNIKKRILSGFQENGTENMEYNIYF